MIEWRGSFVFLLRRFEDIDTAIQRPFLFEFDEQVGVGCLLSLLLPDVRPVHLYILLVLLSMDAHGNE